MFRFVRPSATIAAICICCGVSSSLRARGPRCARPPLERNSRTAFSAQGAAPSASKRWCASCRCRRARRGGRRGGAARPSTTRSGHARTATAPRREPVRLGEDRVGRLRRREQPAAARGGRERPAAAGPLRLRLEHGQRAARFGLQAGPDLALDQVGHPLHVVGLATPPRSAISRVGTGGRSRLRGGRGRVRAARGRRARASPAPGSRCGRDRRHDVGVSACAVGVAGHRVEQQQHRVPEVQELVGVLGEPERVLGESARGRPVADAELELGEGAERERQVLTRPLSRAIATARSSSRRAVS